MDHPWVPKSYGTPTNKSCIRMNDIGLLELANNVLNMIPLFLEKHEGKVWVSSFRITDVIFLLSKASPPGIPETEVGTLLLNTQ